MNSTSHLSKTVLESPVTVHMESREVSVFYGSKQALYNISVPFLHQSITALIGPSGCGKSTFLRCMNRMNDTIEHCRVTGSILLDGADIYDIKQDVVTMRARVGMVFQKPNPFPKTIYENVAYGLKLHHLYDHKKEIAGVVEASLKRTGLWDEVKDRLHQNAFSLSGEIGRAHV